MKPTFHARRGRPLGGRHALLLAGACLLARPMAAAETPLVAIGVTQPRVDVVLSASVPGIISAQNFREGDRVKAGDVILELDKRFEELEVTRRNEVLRLRTMDFEATATLYEKTKSVPKEELDKKTVDRNVAQVEYDMAVEQLKRRMVVAPHEGIVTRVLLDVGEATEAYQPLVRLVDPLRCEFESNVEARIAAALRLNQRVRLEVDTGQDPASVEGEVAFISPVADPASGLINIKVFFENPEGELRPGLAGRLFIRE